MHKFTFLSHTETLRETLSKINPKFSTLLELIPELDRHRLGAVDLSFCENSFVFENDILLDIDLD
jgi:hypothetical protein